jgi:3-oxoacyl-(acyl-carrier-protein) synthase
MPDAIISGTGLGCIESTEIFLTAMLNEGEEFLQPTHFMQSTHNTISSQIAIDLQCHGYNTTYSHKGISFDSALLDAFLQFRAGKIHSALVGGYDEMTPNYQLMLSRLGDWRKDGEDVKLQRGEEAFAGETSVSMMLTDLTAETTPLCRVAAVEILYQPDVTQLQEALNRVLQENGCALSDIDAVMTGMNGNKSTDDNYRKVINSLFAGRPLGNYKQIFGEAYTASGLGVYACAVCLQKGEIPAHLLWQQPTGLKNIQRILLYHQYDNKNHSLILLTSC